MRHSKFLLGASIFALMSSASAAQAALVISNDATNNVTCDAGVCMAMAKNAVLNVTDLGNLISSSPVTIQSGNEAQDIVFNAPFSWTSSNGLTLNANAIIVNKPVSDSGFGAFELTVEPSFGLKGNVSFLSTSNILVIQGSTYQLVDSIASLASAVKNKEKYIALAHDYDASADGVYTAAPIKELDYLHVEGLGNTISNLTIHGTKYVGLVGNTTSSYLQNIRLKKVEMSLNGQGDYTSQIGALLAYDHSSTSVDGCSSSGKITAANATTVGGLVGSGYFASFENNSSAVSVKATQNGASTYVGGLAGGTNGGNNDYATGAVQGDGHVGGLAGESSAIQGSYATGTVSVSDPDQFSAVGGLVGSIIGTSKDTVSLLNSYATGSVTVGAGLTGGLIGYIDGRRDRDSVLRSSYSIGAISVVEGNPAIGGLAGSVSFRKPKETKTNYWDVDTSGVDKGTGQGNIAGITGLTDEQMKSGLPKGFDPNIWAENPKINNGYPYLIANPPPK